jgi:hypothetical protein
VSYAPSMLAEASDRDVVLRCQYEIAVATLRGSNTLRSADDLVRSFYVGVLNEEVDAGLLEDAIVLGQYRSGALGRNLTELTASAFVAWYGQGRPDGLAFG